MGLGGLAGTFNMNRLSRLCLCPIITRLNCVVWRRRPPSIMPRQQYTLWLNHLNNYHSSRPLFAFKKDLKNVKVDAEVAAVLETENRKKIKVFGIGDDLMMVTTVFKAKEQAKRGGLKLVELDASAKPYPTYKFMSGKELHGFQMQQKDTKKLGRKSEKHFRISTKTSSHDLEVKMKQIKEWIQKGSDVKLSIKASHNASDEEAASQNSEMLKTITNQILDIAVIKQASQSGKDMLIIIKPKAE